MSVHDETWNRPHCKVCGKVIEYAQGGKHGEGICYDPFGRGHTEAEIKKFRTFESGAIRDVEEESGKEDYVETISWTAFRRYADYMTQKKAKYGSGNFKKGIPIDSYERSMTRHISKYFINKYEGGDLEKNEDHLAAILFNVFGIIHEEEMNKLTK